MTFLFEKNKRSTCLNLYMRFKNTKTAFILLLVWFFFNFQIQLLDITATFILHAVVLYSF